MNEDEETLMMDSTHSMAPTDEELLRYVLDDDALSEEQQAHIEHCATCQQRLEDYKSTSTFLLSKLYRTQCPTTAELNFFCAGDILPIETVFRIDAHLRACPLCDDEVATIRRSLKSFNPFPAAELTALPLVQVLPATIRRVVATLNTQKPQLVTRSGSTATPQTSWPRHYRAEHFSISLHLLHASTGEIMLLGLFTSDDPDESVDTFDGVVAELYASSTQQKAPAQQNGHLPSPLLSATVDDLGNLAFKSVPPDTYTMLVHLPTIEVAIEGLVIA